MRENLLGCKYIGVQGHGIFREQKLLGVIEIVAVRKSKTGEGEEPGVPPYLWNC